MDVYRPLRAVLFIYECFRLFALLGLFIIFSPFGKAESAFPYLVYVAPNALFPLMMLFVWVELRLFKPYLGLYLAGKIIILVSFYAWELFTYQQSSQNIDASFLRATIANRDVLIFFNGSMLLMVTDILSILGVWWLRSKIKRVESARTGLPAGEVGGV